MTTFQQLIREAEKSEDGEADRSMDLRLEIRTHGKPVHLWKLALRLQRFIQVSFGNTTTFMTISNDELVDDFTDDDGENWHSHDWVADPDPRDEGLHEDVTRESHPAESKEILAPLHRGHEAAKIRRQIEALVRRADELEKKEGVGERGD